MAMRSAYLLTLLAGATLPTSVLAQTAAVPTAGSALTTDDIIVTAQKREQRLQDVPVSVTVLGNQALTNAKIDTGTEIARQTPNLRVSLLGDESQPKFALRGLSTPEFNLNAISPTGIFFDEVYIGASYLGGAQLFDVERVEVLRGPQGTLFGKNTTAGAINFISKAPTFRNEGEITAGGGSYGFREVKGAGEAPLIADRLSVRFAFDVARSNGYIKNLNPAGRNLSSIDRAAGRLSLGYKDDSGFDATLRVFAVQDDPRAIGAINEGTGPGGTNAYGINPRVNPFTGAPLTRHQVVTDRSGNIEVRGVGGYLTMNKDLGFATLTSITSFVKGRFLNLVDGDGTIAPLLHIDFAAKNREFSQDLRLSSNPGSPLQWIIGVYHQQDKVDVDTNYFLFGGSPFQIGLDQQYTQKRRSFAAYADLTYDISDMFTVYGGIRYTKDKGRLYDFRVVPIIPTQPAQRYNDGQPTGRAGLRVKLTPDIMIYGQYARGYRSSAINGGALTNPADLSVAKPEKLDAYEVGLKSELFDRLLTFNASAFLYNFRNQQFINVVGIGAQQLVNAGRSRIKGIELEASLRPFAGFSLSAGLGLLDSEYRQLILNGVDLAGKELIEAPHHTLNLAGDYTLNVGHGNALSFHADATNVASQFFSPTNAPVFRVPAYWDLGARVAFRMSDGRYELAVYGKNLTNNTKSTGIQIDPSTQTKFSTVPYPRRYGVELTAKF